MATGILLTTPGKNRFWYPCEDAKTGLAEMADAHAGANMYGKAWGHADTRIEFGSVDPETNKFTLLEHISGPKAEAKETHVEQKPASGTTAGDSAGG